VEITTLEKLITDTKVIIKFLVMKKW
jgi:hypothetical protein